MSLHFFFLNFLHISLSIAIYVIHNSLYTMGMRKKSRKDTILNLVISNFFRKCIIVYL